MSKSCVTFFVWKVSNPDQFPDCSWKVSNPESRHQNCKRIGLVHTLVMSIKPICRYSSTWCRRGKSWSRHQKLQEDWLGTKDETGSSNVHLDSSNPHLDLVPQELILVTAPKIARGWDWYKDIGYYFISISLCLLSL